jgi:hypothetical protein
LPQEYQLDWATGLYIFDKDNHFLISARGPDLYLKIENDREEKISPRGDGLYAVENTEIKIKFHRSGNSIANSITLYFPDKQIVAARKLLITKEQSYFSKVKELVIFMVILLVLVGISPYLYRPIKEKCLRNASPMSCRLANFMAPIFSSKKEMEAIRGQLSKTTYSESRADIQQACQEGDQNACLEVAKQKFQIGVKEDSFTILKKSCFEHAHGPSCQQWYQYLILESKVTQAQEMILNACEKKIGLACHEYGWILRKNKDPQFVTYFDKACTQNESESCFELGKHHLQFNRNRSYDYFKKACLGYHRKACDLRDKVEAFFEAESECLKQDDAHACFLMASFEFDYGDRAKSLTYYKMACSKGSAHACTFLKRSEAFNQFEKENKKSLETI